MEEISRLVTKARMPGGSLVEKNEAFDEIVLRFQDMAYGCAYAILGDAHLAHDAAQEAFLAAWRSLHQLERPEAFPAWFKRVLVSQCHRLTRGQRPGTVALESALDLPAAEMPPDVIAERNEVRSRIAAAIEALPESERVVTTLFYMGDHSYAEIAQFLDLPLSTIKKRLYSARRRLRERLTELLRDRLRERRPSRDERFRYRVQFFNAIRAGDVATVGQLLAAGGASCDLFTACRAGAIEVIEALLESDPGLIDAADANGSIPLEYALWGYPENISAVVKFLFNWNPALNIFTGARFGRLERVMELLERNPSLVHATDGLIGWTPLHFAAQNWCPPEQGAAVAELLITCGAEVNSRGEGGSHWTPLQATAEWWHDVEIAEVLLNHGADINARTDSGWTPLGYALEKGRTPMAEFLRRRGGKE